jgi:organic hydroperoxide reductase OsmC/OhrA
MTAAFPHRYEVRLTREEGSRATLTAPPRPALTGGPPPEFGGHAEWWSPEHLLLSAASLCLMTTFQSLAARAGLTVNAYKASVAGVLDKTPEGLVFTSITHAVEIRVAPGQMELAHKVIQSAKKHCIVSNSLRTPVSVEADVCIG